METIFVNREKGKSDELQWFRFDLSYKIDKKNANKTYYTWENIEKVYNNIK